MTKFLSGLLLMSLSMIVLAQPGAPVAWQRNPTTGVWAPVVPSANGTLVTTATQSIVDNTGIVWTLNLTAGGVVVMNGSPDYSTYGVKELAFEAGVVWQYNGTAWFSKTPLLWTPGTTVSPVSTTISWVAPTTNVDGSPLTNLGGYSVSYGLSATTMTTVAKVPATANSYTIPNLAPGSWFFEVAAVTVPGVSSAESVVVSKVVP